MGISEIIPPQAYTRDALVEAFEWLQHQPASVRERATHADTLVGLYLTAKRRGRVEEPPSRLETFKTDLRSLAEGLNNQPLEPAVSPAVSSAISPVISLRALPLHPNHHSPQQNFKQESSEVMAVDPASHSQIQLDEKSLELVQDIQSRMNLSSQHETLRAMISIAHERLNSLLPPTPNSKTK